MVDVLVNEGWDKKNAESVVPYSEGSVSKAGLFDEETIAQAKDVFDSQSSSVAEALDKAAEWSDMIRSGEKKEGLLLALAGFCRMKWRKNIESDQSVDDMLAIWKALSKSFYWWETTANKQLLFEELLLRLEDKNSGKN